MQRLAITLATLVLGSLPAYALQDNPISPTGPSGEPDRIELAQLQLNLGGGSDANILRTLGRAGYTEIEIFYRGLTKSRVRACRGADRLQMEVAPNGRVKSSAKIGECRSRINMARARDILRNKGYREILLEDTGRGGYRGTACLKNRRMDMAVGYFGKVREIGQLGRCRQILSRKEVAQRLRSNGYDRIKVAKDSPPPPFFVEACKGQNRVDLVVVGNGRVQRERRIGRCEPPIKPNQIAGVLQKQGFTRVRVTDDVLPRYGAQACRGDDRIELVLNRFGEVRDERKIGQCPRPLTRDQLVRQLTDEGFRRISVKDDPGRGFVVEACLAEERVRINISPYGETSSEKVLGPCKSPRIGKVLRDFKQQGLNRAKIFVEGCRRGQRVKIELDSFGDKVRSRRIGRCQ